MSKKTSTYFIFIILMFIVLEFFIFNTASAGGPGLYVSLDSSTPPGQTLAKGKTDVTFMIIRIDGETDAYLDSIWFSLNQGSGADVKNIRLIDADSGANIGATVVDLSSGNANFSGLSLLIPAGGYKKIKLVADVSISATTGSVIQFGVPTASGRAYVPLYPDPPISVSITGLPVVGNVMSISSIIWSGSSPVIDSIAPLEGKQGQTITIEIRGKNFNNQINFSGCGINPISENGFSLNSCSVISDNLIKAIYTITSTAKIGTRAISLATSNTISNSLLFNIIAGTSHVTVVSPNGGEVWEMGKTYNITWTPTNLSSTVNIFINRDSFSGPAAFIARGIINTGSYSWDTAKQLVSQSGGFSVLSPANDYRITIADANGTIIDTGDQSNATFTFVAAGTHSSITLPEGALIRATGDIDVYIVKYVGTKKFKRLILSPSVFNSYGHLHWSDIKEVERSVADSFATSDLVRAVNDPKVYKLYPSGDTGEKRWVTTSDAFSRMSFDWDSIYEINQVDRDSYNTGQSI